MNRSTRIFVTVMGILTALGGAGHGIAEILQGDAPATDIGNRIGAFTIIPNYLATGIAALAVSIIIVFWTVGFIHKKFGALVYLLLSIALFLVGGGVAQSLGIIIAFLVATRINKPLTFWKKIIGPNARKPLSRLWFPAMIAGFGLLAAGISIWLIFIPPGEIREISIYQYVCWSALALGFVFIMFTIVSGFARDIFLNDNGNSKGASSR